MNDTLLSRMVLKTVPGLGPAVCEALIGSCGGAAGVLREAAAGALARFGVPDAAASALRDVRRREAALREIGEAERHGILILVPESPEYPEPFRGLRQVPPLLYVKGRIETGRRIAIVGTRRPTRQGERHALRFAEELAAAGIEIVSGLARGIDAAAHEGALSAHGRTTAVLGSGLLAVYPEENRPLAEKIVREGGAVISEFWLHEAPKDFYFPMRNRLISAFSDAVLVIEAPKKSGALITADYALEEGKDVFAVPGDIHSAQSEGSNRLIQDGAFCALSPQDILLRKSWPAPYIGVTDSTGPAQDPVLDAARGGSAGSLEEMARETGLSPAELLSRLSELESRGLITAARGGYRGAGPPAGEAGPQ